MNSPLKTILVCDYPTPKYSSRLDKLDDKEFTITHVESENYIEGHDVIRVVKVTTKEYFEIDRKYTNKFHLFENDTNQKIIFKLSNTLFQSKVNDGKSLVPVVKIIKKKISKSKEFHLDLV